MITKCWHDDISTVPCNITGSRKVVVIGNQDRRGHPLRTVLCKDSGLAWTDPRPAKDVLGRFYKEKYRLDYKKSYQPRKKHIYRAGKVALDRYERFSTYLCAGARVLDVGSGGGEFVYLLGLKNCQAAGIEPNEGYAEYAIQEYGNKVLKGTFEEFEPSPSTFDVITLFHVLEHLDDPGSGLTHLKRCLKKNGLIIVEVPNLEARVSAPLQKFHFAHLYHFNLVTLEAVGAKAGLKRVASDMSGDGGNIEIIFTPAARIGAVDLTGNFENILRIIHSHKPLRHYMSKNPYIRPLKKLAGRIEEYKNTRNCSGGKDILNFLYQSP